MFCRYREKNLFKGPFPSNGSFIVDLFDNGSAGQNAADIEGILKNLQFLSLTTVIIIFIVLN
jgi:hypothetical protein